MLQHSYCFFIDNSGANHQMSNITENSISTEMGSGMESSKGPLRRRFKIIEHFVTFFYLDSYFKELVSFRDSMEFDT